MSYQVWATTDNGDGMVQDLGKYDEVENIHIQCGMFENDVIITIEEHYEPEDEIVNKIVNQEYP